MQFDPSSTARFPKRGWSWCVAAVLAVLLFAAPAFAADPPGRVGRVGELQGQAWLYSPQDGEWIGAVRNRPLTGGDRLATDPGARAELRIGSTALRLDGGSELEVMQLDDAVVRVMLHGGRVAVRLRSADAAGEFELFTAGGRFTADRPGQYRVERYNDTDVVAVRSGQALFQTADNGAAVPAGQRAEIWRDPATRVAFGPVDGDAFSDWVAVRERADDRAAASRFVSPEMTGAEDLDAYGRWQNEPDYGALWLPHGVAADWAPYRYGHWAWVAPWGWTWVDDAPWGFAPFHYGRWVNVRGAWGWSPGAYVARPVYAPALVAWVGGPQAGFSVSLGGAPAVGWFPLGPREVYVPGYRVSPGYVRNVNFAHVPNLRDAGAIVDRPDWFVQQHRYMNRDVPNALTIVPAAIVARRQPVAPSVLAFPGASGGFGGAVGGGPRNGGGDRDRPGWRGGPDPRGGPPAPGSAPAFGVVAAPPVDAPSQRRRFDDPRPGQRYGNAPGATFEPPPPRSSGGDHSGAPPPRPGRWAGEGGDPLRSTPWPQPGAGRAVAPSLPQPQLQPQPPNGMPGAERAPPWRERDRDRDRDAGARGGFAPPTAPNAELPPMRRIQPVPRSTPDRAPFERPMPAPTLMMPTPMPAPAAPIAMPRAPAMPPPAAPIALPRPPEFRAPEPRPFERRVEPGGAPPGAQPGGPRERHDVRDMMRGERQR